MCSGFRVVLSAPLPQFPDEDNGLHSIIVGLILVAVALPFKVIVEEILAQGNEPEFPEQSMSWPLSYRLLLGKQTWHFLESKPTLLTVLFARFAHEKINVRRQRERKRERASNRAVKDVPCLRSLC